MNKQKHQHYSMCSMSPSTSAPHLYQSFNRSNQIVSLLNDVIVCSRSATCSRRLSLPSMSSTEVSNTDKKENRDTDDDDSMATSSSCLSFASFASTKSKLSISDFLLSLPEDKINLKTGISSNTGEGSLHDSFHRSDFDITVSASRKCKTNDHYDTYDDSDDDDDDTDDSSYSSFNYDDYSSSRDEDDNEDDNDGEWDDIHNILLEELRERIQMRQGPPKSPRQVRFRDITIREYSNFPQAVIVDEDGTTDAVSNDRVTISSKTMISTNEFNNSFVNHANSTSTFPEVTNDATQLTLSLYSIQRQLQQQGQRDNSATTANAVSKNHHRNSNISKSQFYHDTVMNIDDYEWIRQMKSYVRLLDKTSKTMPSK